MKRKDALHMVLAVTALCSAGAVPAAGSTPTVSFGRVPLSFEKNTGRYDKRVKFIARTGPGAVFLTNTEAVLVVPEIRVGAAADAAPTCRVLRMKLAGSRPDSAAMGVGKRAGIVDYFIGNDRTKWFAGVPTYAKARFANVYPGTDLVYYGTEARGKGEGARGSGRG